MPTLPTDRIPLYRTIAIVASCLGLFTACGIGFHPAAPPPPPEPILSEIDLRPNPLEFAPTRIGTTSAPQMLTITNRGTLPIRFASITTGFPVFRVLNQTCTQVALAPGDECAITVIFKPTVAKPVENAINITSTGSRFFVVKVHGSGLDEPPSAPAEAPPHGS